MSPRSILAWSLITVLTPGSAFGQQFDWFFQLETGFRTSGVAMADFDGDGFQDLACAVAEHWPLPTLVFLNDGYGNFDLDQTHRGRDQKGQAVEVGDLNADAWQDLVLVTELGDRNVVFLNDGSGRLSTYPDIAVAGGIMSAVFLNSLGPSVGRWQN